MKTAKTRQPRRSSQPKGIQRFDLKDISDELYDHRVKLQIDDSLPILKKLTIGPWKNEPNNLKTFVRRTLEVATTSAMFAEDEFKTETIADWRKAAVLSKAAARNAKQASSSIQKLISYMSGVQGDPDKLGNTEQTFSAIDVLSKQIGRMRGREARTEGKPILPQSAAEIGKKDASSISTALNTLIWFEAHCNHLSREVAETYKNPGVPQKRAFALVILEGWTFLTHKRPSPSNTKFVQFLQNAWSDVSSIETDWTQAIKSETKKLDQGTVQFLIQNGPLWMR